MGINEDSQAFLYMSLGSKGLKSDVSQGHLLAALMNFLLPLKLIYLSFALFNHRFRKLYKAKCVIKFKSCALLQGV